MLTATKTGNTITRRKLQKSYRPTIIPLTITSPRCQRAAKQYNVIMIFAVLDVIPVTTISFDQPTKTATDTTPHQTILSLHS